MEIKQIHSMFWADAGHTCVGLTADTDTGTNEIIATPYNETSIIWSAVKAYPVDQITEYVEPLLENPTFDQITEYVEPLLENPTFDQITEYVEPLLENPTGQ